jgi:hypothetical protein
MTTVPARGFRCDYQKVTEIRVREDTFGNEMQLIGSPPPSPFLYLSFDPEWFFHRA